MLEALKPADPAIEYGDLRQAIADGRHQEARTMFYLWFAKYSDQPESLQDIAAAIVQELAFFIDSQTFLAEITANPVFGAHLVKYLFDVQNTIDPEVLR